MGETAHLLGHRRHHLGVAMAGVHHRDTGRRNRCSGCPPHPRPRHSARARHRPGSTCRHPGQWPCRGGRRDLRSTFSVLSVGACCAEPGSGAGADGKMLRDGKNSLFFHLYNFLDIAKGDYAPFLDTQHAQHDRGYIRPRYRPPPARLSRSGGAVAADAGKEGRGDQLHHLADRVGQGEPLGRRAETHPRRHPGRPVGVFRLRAGAGGGAGGVLRRRGAGGDRQGQAVVQAGGRQSARPRFDDFARNLRHRAPTPAARCTATRPRRAASSSPAGSR